eukprot:TRINITY_DN128_c0_g1_i1.p1 TRINITY_DN128_c0_g1~~TRINITY_DN128_c0_g1_i1.p1  ORF type:complete len:152 (-),score=7.07 TRINITY_DN128_c0_g1_i1:280-735(-)
MRPPTKKKSVRTVQQINDLIAENRSELAKLDAEKKRIDNGDYGEYTAGSRRNYRERLKEVNDEYKDLMKEKKALLPASKKATPAVVVPPPPPVEVSRPAAPKQRKQKSAKHIARKADAKAYRKITRGKAKCEAEHRVHVTAYCRAKPKTSS